MTRTSWVELCVSDFEQSIIWFEQALGFRVVAREANEYAELSCGETTIQLAADDAPYWEPERPRLLSPGQRGSGVEIVLLVETTSRLSIARPNRPGQTSCAPSPITPGTCGSSGYAIPMAISSAPRRRSCP